MKPSAFGVLIGLLGGLVPFVPTAAGSTAAGPTTAGPTTAGPAAAGSTFEDPSVSTFDAAAPLRVAGSWSATFASRYLFQGMDQSAGHAVIQPEVGVSYGPASAGIWVNYDVTTTQANEIDGFARMDREFGAFSAGLSYVALRYPNRDADPTQEVVLDGSWSRWWIPALSLHYDFDAGRGLYSTLGIERELGTPLGLSGGLEWHHQSGYYGMNGVPAIALHLGMSREIRTLSFNATAARSFTWENQSFRDDAAVPSEWLLAIGVGSRD